MERNKTIFATLIFFVVFISSYGYAQTKKVPPFQMVQANGTLFNAENLPLGKPIVIVYFSTDCEDCQQLTNELLVRINKLEKASIAMITYQSRDNLIQFVSKFNINKYSNIYVGTEGNSYFIANYYNVGKIPFMALYNKDGDLIKLYDKGNNIDDLIIRLKNL